MYRCSTSFVSRVCKLKPQGATTKRLSIILLQEITQQKFKNMNIKRTCTRIFKAALFVIVKHWHQSKYSATVEWISCVYSNNGIFHSKEYVQVTATCNNRHRSQKHRAKAVNIGQNKSSLLEQNTVYSIRYKFQKVGKIILFKGIGLSA